MYNSKKLILSGIITTIIISTAILYTTNEKGEITYEIQLDDGSILKKIDSKNMQIKKGKLEFNISSSSEIVEVNNITETKEWKYQNSGYEIIKSDSQLYFIEDKILKNYSDKISNFYGKSLCIDVDIYKSSSMYGNVFYEICIFYPYQDNKGNFISVHEEDSINNFTLKDNVAKINFIAEYDPFIYLKINVSGIDCFEYNQYDVYSCDRALDNDTSTYAWIQESSIIGDWWFMINFTTPKNISKIRSIHDDTTNVDYQIRASNINCNNATKGTFQAKYNLIASNFTNPGKNVWSDINFSSSDLYTCWALFPYSNVTSGWLKIKEAEFYIINASEQSEPDSCTYEGGNWDIDCSDNCILESTETISGNVTMKNSGIIDLWGEWYFNESKQKIDIFQGCEFNIISGSQIIGGGE